MKQTLLTMLMMLLPMLASADDSGVCGDGVTYSYDDETKTLTISKTGEGSGAMYDYDKGSTQPWTMYIVNIETVIIEDGVTSIGVSDFQGCYMMTSVSIPPSVTAIGDKAFGGCFRLESADILEGVVSIGYSAFQQTAITSLVIPKSVTAIGDDAFSACGGLTSVIIPDNVTSIGSTLFSFCSNLTSIVLPDNATEVPEGLCYECSSLTSVTIPSGITKIGSSAFAECSSLETIDIPNSVTVIDFAAFQGCTNLHSIIIPNNVTEIGDQAFYGCSSMVLATIPDNVTKIGTYTFANCSSLVSVEVGNGVTTIRYNAFENCSSMKNLVLGKNVSSIGDNAFLNCTALEEIICYSEDVPKITGRSFKGVELNNVTLYVPGISVDKYKATWRGFKDILPIPGTEDVHSEYTDPQTNVVYTYYPDDNSAGVKPGRSYWSGGSEQESENTQYFEAGSPNVAGDVNILDKFEADGKEYTVNQIGDLAFYQCVEMTAVTLPETITSIGSSAFGLCTNLSTIVSYIEEPFDTDAFIGLNTSNKTLYVPKGCVEKYKAARGWSDFGNVMELVETDIRFLKHGEQNNIKGSIFDLNGQRLTSPPRKGIYIQDGKKKQIKHL